MGVFSEGSRFGWFERETKKETTNSGVPLY